jgi:SAM-dependent methyltransferase
MNPLTIAALNRINRRFYSDRSEQFSQTRKTPWPGWAEVVATFQDHRSTIFTTPRLSILDVGCGNSRLLPAIEGQLHEKCRYVGVDSSLPMLVEALKGAVGRSRVPAVLVATDLVSGGGLECLEPQTFDLAAAFGLLHHIPGRQTRVHLLRSMADRLEPGGVLAVSFWQFGEQERFLRRVIPWEAYNRRASERIDVAELEEGDVLLTWGDAEEAGGASRGPAARYCHFTDESAAEQLIESLDMEILAHFFSDGDGGRQNLYYVLGKSASN